MRSCLGRTVALVLLLAVGVLAWLNRDRLRDAWREHRGSGQAAVERTSPELADRAVQKLARMDTDPRARRVALGEAEVQSLLEYRMRQSLPPYLDQPRVALRDDGIDVRARVAKSAMPPLPGAGELMGMLPDTTEVKARARLLPLAPGRVALAVSDMSAASIPVPGRVIPGLLSRIGRQPEPGLPTDAIAVRLPAGVCSAYVHADSLVLLGRGAARDCR